MFRFTLLAALFLVACGPAEAVVDAGTFPFFTNQPSSAQRDAGSGSGGGSAVPVNMAQKVWVAQEKAFRTSGQLRATYGENALSWLRAAKVEAGRQVRTGTIVERADNSVAYTSGGTTLRITTKSGRHYELRVGDLVGDVSGVSFPATGERIDVTWIFTTGATARCVLEHNASHFVGTFVNDQHEEFDADVSDSAIVTASNGQFGPDMVTHAHREGSYWGFLVFADRRIDFDTRLVSAACVGACGPSAAYDFFYTHDVKLTMGAAIWNLHYNTGWTQQYTYSLTEYYWGGSIVGTSAGRMEKRPVAANVFALDVVIGADRFTTTGVADP